jgi:hypothetical protein
MNNSSQPLPLRRVRFRHAVKRFASAALVLSLTSIPAAAAGTDRTSGGSFDDPQADVTRLYAKIRKGLSASTALKRCDAQALQSYAIQNLGQYVNAWALLNLITAEPLKKTPAKFVRNPPSRKAISPSNDLAQYAQALQESNSEYEGRRQVYDAFTAELTQEFTTFLIADNAAALGTLCHASRFTVLRTNNDGPMSTALIELGTKTGGRTGLQLLLVRAWSTWVISDIRHADEWLSNRYERRFAHEVESNGLDGLLARLRSINAEPK